MFYITSNILIAIVLSDLLFFAIPNCYKAAYYDEDGKNDDYDQDCVRVAIIALSHFDIRAILGNVTIAIISLNTVVYATFFGPESAPKDWILRVVIVNSFIAIAAS